MTFQLNIDFQLITRRRRLSHHLKYMNDKTLLTQINLKARQHFQTSLKMMDFIIILGLA